MLKAMHNKAVHVLLAALLALLLASAPMAPTAFAGDCPASNPVGCS